MDRDRQAERRAATRNEILEAAWDLARAHGLAGLSLGDVARRIGMKTPSLYWYFDSKHAIYDAMFVQGNEELLARLRAARWGATARSVLRTGARIFVEFSVEDLARYQLLFQREAGITWPLTLTVTLPKCVPTALPPVTSGLDKTATVTVKGNVVTITGPLTQNAKMEFDWNC